MYSVERDVNFGFFWITLNKFLTSSVKWESQNTHLIKTVWINWANEWITFSIDRVVAQ